MQEEGIQLTWQYFANGNKYKKVYMPNVLKIKAKYLVVHQASVHGNLLARQPDLVVPGKRTVVSVSPVSF
jgi:hypothetical protein